MALFLPSPSASIIGYYFRGAFLREYLIGLRWEEEEYYYLSWIEYDWLGYFQKREDERWQIDFRMETWNYFLEEDFLMNFRANGMPWNYADCEASASSASYAFTWAIRRRRMPEGGGGCCCWLMIICEMCVLCTHSTYSQSVSLSISLPSPTPVGLFVGYLQIFRCAHKFESLFRFCIISAHSFKSLSQTFIPLLPGMAV